MSAKYYQKLLHATRKKTLSAPSDLSTSEPSASHGKEESDEKKRKVELEKVRGYFNIDKDEPCLLECQAALKRGLPELHGLFFLFPHCFAFTAKVWGTKKKVKKIDLENQK